jgi:carbonic anhydrase
MTTVDGDIKILNQTSFSMTKGAFHNFFIKEYSFHEPDEYDSIDGSRYFLSWHPDDKDAGKVNNPWVIGIADNEKIEEINFNIKF